MKQKNKILTEQDKLEENLNNWYEAGLEEGRRKAFDEIKLLQEILLSKYNVNCNCPTCKNITKRIKKSLGSENDKSH